MWEVLKQSSWSDQSKLIEEISDMKISLQNAWVDPETSPKYQELHTQLKAGDSFDSLEQDVYSHLTNFFKRYYKDGDFISLRRYKADTYAIPYEWEEVKLYRANHDQYYIKSTENLKNYIFTIDKQKVVFRLVDASTEQNNNKAINNKERRFQLHEEQPYLMEDGTLIIQFSYELHEKKTKQDTLNKQAIETLQSSLPTDLNTIVFALTPTEKNKKRTILEKHLSDFTAKHSFDYFIHKDLDGFLRREMDFYIKNEVLHIDDIASTTESKILSQIGKIKAIKQVAGKLITFLWQLENFQKRLWEKKKFVTNTQYCITLDKIHEKFYPEILATQAQLDEWKDYYDAEIKSIEDLKAEPFLVLDTIYFSVKFRDKILATFDDIDDECNGLLVNSENWQALNLLQERYRGQIKCIYIDPPYNTWSDGFIYKDNFNHSSWISFMEDRLNVAYNLLTEDWVIYISIDDNELYNLKKICDNVFWIENFVNNNAIKMSRATWVKMTHERKKWVKYKEYWLVYAKNKNLIKINPQYVESNDIDKRYNKFILKNWEDVSTRELINLKDEIKRRWIDLKELEKFYMDFADCISRTAHNTQDVFLKTKWVKKITKVVTSTWLNKLAYNWEKLLTYDSKLKIINWESKFWENIWDRRYDIVSHINDLSNEWWIDLPNWKKPEFLLKRIIEMFTSEWEFVLDFFAWTWTTWAVCNKIDRKYINIDMWDYFNNKLHKRIKNTLSWEQRWISKLVNWKWGWKIKYLVMESYEDTLNNLKLSISDTQKSLLTANPDLNEEYTLKYMLDIESRDSLLSINDFCHPFDYQLAITKHNETKYTTIDLVETFNYLIWLKVHQQYRAKDIKVVIWSTLDDQRVLILRRDLDVVSNDMIEDYFKKRAYEVKDDFDFDIIYVNGDTTLENLRTEEEHRKVRMIEEVFLDTMFSGSDSFSL